MRRKVICLLGILCLCPIAARAAADGPWSIAGFRLGEDIAQLQPRVRMESRLPLRHEEYLEEVETQPLEGFKSGLIIYGNCAAPGRVVRIKLKYADASPAFYDRLLQEVKKRWGEPAAYEGDPFHIVVDWKWVFDDGQGNRITLHLGHNTRDAEEKLGNTIKLTLLNAIEAERTCYLAKHPEPPQSPSQPPVPPEALSTDDWQRLLPR